MYAALLDEFGIGDAHARDEAWRYSKSALRALEQQSFVEVDAASDAPASLIERFDWAETRGRRVVFVNGRVCTQHSSDASDGFAIRHGRNASTIHLRDGGKLHLVFASVPGATASRWRHNLEIDVASGRAELIEQHLGIAGPDVLGVVHSAFAAAPAAELQAIVLSDLPDSASLYRREQVSLAADAAYRSTHALFGGRLQRFDVQVELAGTHSAYAARGMFAARARQHIDVHLDARHRARDTFSDISWRGVADQRGRGILHGALSVSAGADGADARLQTKNLLLSPHAEIDAQPVLEIYADEVKASHGATVGQLDERALFYLRSRGVPLAIARNLLIAGFCREAFEHSAGDDLRARLETLLAERLPQAGGQA